MNKKKGKCCLNAATGYYGTTSIEVRNIKRVILIKYIVHDEYLANIGEFLLVH